MHTGPYAWQGASRPAFRQRCYEPESREKTRWSRSSRTVKFGLTPISTIEASRAIRSARRLPSLPVLDISPFLRESTPDERIHMARALRSACIDIGFFYLIGHGFTPSKLDAVLAQGRRFFELPVPEKLKLLSHNVDEPGYVRMGGVDPEKNRDKVVDIKERLSLSRDLMPGEQLSANSRMGKSQWPSRALLPDFEPTMKGYISSLQRIVGALNHAFALSLSLPEDHFDSDYGRPSTTLMLNYYPPGRSRQVGSDPVELFTARRLHGLHRTAAG